MTCLTAIRLEFRKYRLDYCEDCETTEGYIVAHHIDGNPLNGDSENCRTVCRRCHYIYHLAKVSKRHKYVPKELEAKPYQALLRAVFG